MDTVTSSIIAFCKATILGHESALYKQMHQEKDMQSEEMLLYALAAAIHYLNVCYKSLILQDDDYVTEQFSKMQTAHHSPICLLHFLLQIITTCHTSMDRKKLNPSSYTTYMHSVDQLITPTLQNTQEHLQKHMNHECSGDDITKCDPNVPLFYKG